MPLASTILTLQSSNAPSHSLPIPSSRQFTTIGPDNVTYDEADGLHLSLRPGEVSFIASIA